MKKPLIVLALFCVLLALSAEAFAQRAPGGPPPGGGGGTPPGLDIPPPTDEPPGRDGRDPFDNDIPFEIQTEPQNFDCGGKTDGFFCGDKDQREVLFQCWNGSVTYSQKCANGCDPQSGTCKAGE